MAVLRYALVLDQGRGSAPEEIVLGDRPLQLIGVAWADRVRHRGLHGVTGPTPATTSADAALGGRHRLGAQPRARPPRGRRPTNPDELAMAAKAAGPPGRHRPGPGPRLRRLGHERRRHWWSVPTGVSGLLELDHAAGTARVLAGTSLDDLLRAIVPAGLVRAGHPRHHATSPSAGPSPPTSTARTTTPPAASAPTCARWCWPCPTAPGARSPPSDHPDEFWATCGGMGLTGTVVEATVGLHPIETSLLLVDSDRVPDLDTLLALLREGGRRHRYSVAWVDLLARGRSLGRAVLDPGRLRHASSDLPTRRPPAATRWPTRPPRAVPAPAPCRAACSTGSSIRAFNELWYRKAPTRAGATSCSRSTKFFYPLDMVGELEPHVRPPGLPAVAVPACRSARRTCCARSSRRSPATRRPASCPCSSTSARPTPGPCRSRAPGGRSALDVPTGDRRPGPLLDRLDRRWLDVGGRLYLAKDSRMRPELVPAMYPRLDEWRAVRDRMDPDRRMASDLARRLDLLG